MVANLMQLHAASPPSQEEPRRTRICGCKPTCPVEKPICPCLRGIDQDTTHDAVSVGIYKCWCPAVLTCLRDDAANSCIKCEAMGMLPWRYTNEMAGLVTSCWRCIRDSRCCSFTPVVPTTVLQVTLVLSGPRAIARHQQLELFVLIGRVGMPGEC